MKQVGKGDAQRRRAFEFLFGLICKYLLTQVALKPVGSFQAAPAKADERPLAEGVCVMVDRFVCVLVIFGLLVAGCRTPTQERVLLRYEPSGRPEVRKAPYHGQYRLYAARMKPPATASATPVVEARLAKGERVGFARDGVGGVFAIVRGERQPLAAAVAGAASESPYVWTMQPDPGQTDWTRTTLLVGTIVVVGVVIGVAAAVSSTSSSSTTIPWAL